MNRPFPIPVTMIGDRQSLDPSLARDWEEEQLVQALPKLDSKRMGRYRLYLDFLRGRQWENSAKKNERRVTLNYAKLLMLKVTSYLMGGSRITVDVEGEQGIAIERALAEVNRLNRLDALDYETELDAAGIGDGCYKVTWNAREGRVQVTAPDPQGIWAWSRPDDVHAVWRVAHRYQVSAEGARQLGGRPKNDGLQWLTEIWTEETMALYLDQTPVLRQINPYGWLPFVLFPNQQSPKELWGESDLEILLTALRELNRELSQWSGIMELSGNPITVLENVDRAEDVQVGPGAVWELPEKSRAYLLDLLEHGGQAHDTYLDRVFRVIYDLSETPATAFGESQKGATGVLVELELQPLIHKVARKRLIRTPVYLRRAELCLKLLDQFAGTSFGEAASLLSLQWGTVTPKDVSRDVDDERLMVGIGLSSRRSSMSRLGNTDPDGDFDRWMDEQRAISELTLKPATADPARNMGGTQERRND